VTGPLAADSLPRFRFLASMPVITPDVRAWRRALERIEDLGYHGVSVSDHVVGGWSMDVLVAMTAAAMATSRLHVRSVVLANDYRHPVLVHRAVASLDVLSGGRVELGLGTGWLPAEYQALGLRLDPPSVRVSRLEEALDIIEGLFAGTVDLEGQAYQVRGVEGLPRPVSVPRPPIMIAGGAPRVLRLAGRRADIAAVLPVRAADGRIAASELEPEAHDRRARLVREGAESAGRDARAIPVHVNLLGFDLAGADGRRHRGASSILAPGTTEAAAGRDVPMLVEGDADEVAGRLVAWRERYGFSDIAVGSDAEAFAGVVARLAGR
jgi:probable F420-dependent oxidoreductase